MSGSEKNSDERQAPTERDRQENYRRPSVSGRVDGHLTEDELARTAGGSEAGQSSGAEQSAKREGSGEEDARPHASPDGKDRWGSRDKAIDVTGRGPGGLSSGRR